MATIHQQSPQSLLVILPPSAADGAHDRGLAHAFISHLLLSGEQKQHQQKVVVLAAPPPKSDGRLLTPADWTSGQKLPAGELTVVAGTVRDRRLLERLIQENQVSMSFTNQICKKKQNIILNLGIRNNFF
jgi:hypothetical protein